MQNQAKQLIKHLSQIKQPLLPELPEQEQSTTPQTERDGNLAADPLVASLMLAYPSLTEQQIEEILQEM
jgi:hypothetical protein